MEAYDGIAYDRVKNNVQKQFFERGLTELLTTGSRIRMPEPNLEKGTKKLNRSTDRVLARVAQQVIYEERPQGGVVSNVNNLVSEAKKIKANSYTLGRMSRSLVISSVQGIPITPMKGITFIPIVFYRSSKAPKI